jgi:hypothetical protein
LKDTGLDELHLIFDGFKDLPLVRDNGLGETRKKALENLKDVGMPTNVEMLVYHNLNEDQIKQTFDYCLQNNFIKGLFLVGYRYLGRKSDSSIKYCLMPEELIDIFTNKVENKINLKEIVKFQKIIFAYFSLFKIRKCFYNRLYLIKRDNNRFISFSQFCDLDLVINKLGTFKKIKQKSFKISFVYLNFFLLAGFLRKTNFDILIKAIRSFWGFLFRRDTRFLSSDFMTINFVTICDGYSIDLGMVQKNCGKGILTSEETASSKGLSRYHRRLLK